MSNVTTTPHPAKAKGHKPTHRLTRIVLKDGEKTFEEVAALWPHKDGRGFSIRLKADLKASDELMIRSINGGAP